MDLISRLQRAVAEERQKRGPVSEPIMSINTTDSEPIMSINTTAAPQNWDRYAQYGFGSDSFVKRTADKRFDSSRWGGGSDGHLYDFAKRFDSSRWGRGSDGHLYDFARK